MHTSKDGSEMQYCTVQIRSKSRTSTAQIKAAINRLRHGEGHETRYCTGTVLVPEISRLFAAALNGCTSQLHFAAAFRGWFGHSTTTGLWTFIDPRRSFTLNDLGNHQGQVA